MSAPEASLTTRDRILDAAETLTATTPASVALVLIDGTPRLADPTWADTLDLGPPNTFVNGIPRWITGSLDVLRARIAATVDEAILTQNPLWNAIGHPSSVIGDAQKLMTVDG